MSGPTSYDCPGIPADMLIAQLRAEIAALKAQLAEAVALVDAATNIEHDIGAGSVWMFARDEGTWDVGVDGKVHACDLSKTEASALFRALAESPQHPVAVE